MPEELNHKFAYHQPGTPRVAEAHSRVRNEHLNLAELLTNLVPPGRELALAHTKLEEAMMWANAGIARNQGKSNELAHAFFESE